jgi:predicted membrane chloride channel (bestrophin family)
MYKHKEPKPSRFDIAMADGRFILPRDMPSRNEFEDFLECFITAYEEFNCPQGDVLYWLGKWKDNHRDCKIVAGIMCIPTDKFRERIINLQNCYERRHPVAGSVSNPADDEELESDDNRKLCHTFEDFLEGFIIAYEWLNCPQGDVIYWLGKWKDNHRDCKIVAAIMGVTPDAIRKRIHTLNQCYKQHHLTSNLN